MVTICYCNKHRDRAWGSDTGGYEEFCLLVYNAMYYDENQPTFRRKTSPSSWFEEQASVKTDGNQRGYVSPKRRLIFQ
jgi:hypothetical protein